MTRNLALALAALVSAHLHAAGWKDPEPIGPATLVGGWTDGKEIRIDAVAEDIFRVRVKRGEEWTESGMNRYGVIPRTLGETAVGKTPESVRTKAGAVVIDCQKGIVRLKSAVSETTLEIAPRLTEKGYEVRFPLTADERIYGLGDVSRANLQRRPGKYEIWVKYNYSYIPLPMTISDRGWGVLMNTTWRNTFDVGETDRDAMICSAAESELDFYLFLGKDKPALLEAYTRLTGRPMMMPIWGYGIVYAAHWEIDQFWANWEALKFREIGFPLDGYQLEPGWMGGYDNTTKKKWDPKKFSIPHWSYPNSVIGSLNRQGYKFGLWFCCDYDLFRYEEQCVAGEAKKRGRPAELPEGVKELTVMWDEHMTETQKKEAKKRRDKTDFPEGERPWFEHLEKFIDQGMRYGMMDCSYQANEFPDRKWANGMTDEEAHNLYTLVYAKQMCEGYEAYTGKRSMFFSPDGYPGFQKYVPTWAGDTGCSPKSCTSLMNLGMSGHANQSCDIGVSDAAELHYGMLQPWTLYNNWFYWRQPWNIGDQAATDRLIAYARMRYRLLPYIYTAAARAYRTGLPVCRPLPLVYPEDPVYDDCRTEYLFGDNLLVGCFRDEMLMPPGEWIDWWSGEKVKGPCRYRLKKDFARGGGLFVRAGAVVPMWKLKMHVEHAWDAAPEFHVWDGVEGDGELYEDDGDDLGYRRGECRLTKFLLKGTANELVIVKSKAEGGAFKNAPDSYLPTLVFHLSAAPEGVEVNGKALTGVWDADRRTYTVVAEEPWPVDAEATVRLVK